MKINISKKVMTIVSILVIIFILISTYIFPSKSIKEGLSSEGRVLKDEIKEVEKKVDDLLKVLQNRRDKEHAERTKALGDLLGDMNDKVGDLEIDPELAASYKRYGNTCMSKLN